ncbi:putative transposase [Desulfosarcina sp. BuS5]|nr:putative transposase [Desulfosarcina sp. BuS5]
MRMINGSLKNDYQTLYITQRGNRRLQTFFSDTDYIAYIDLMKEWCDARGVEIWSYCLMPNQIAVPETKESLMLAIGEAHRRYSRMINFRGGWRDICGNAGLLLMFWMKFIGWHVPVIPYIEMNPARAKLVKDPTHWTGHGAVLSLILMVAKISLRKHNL